MIKDFFYSLFLRHFCVSDNRQLPKYTGKITDKSHYSLFKGKNFFEIDIKNLNNQEFPENQLFILEKNYYNILAFYEKFEFSEFEKTRFLLEEKNSLILHFYTGNTINSNENYVFQWQCKDFSINKENINDFNEVEVIQQAATEKFSRKFDVFLLDYLNCLEKNPINYQEINKDLMNIAKIGLLNAFSLVFRLPNFIDIKELAEIFDNVFFDEALLK